MGTGLSPRVRGNQRADDHRPDLPGSIPACTGEPRNPCAAGERTAVYPRVYGGTKVWVTTDDDYHGLSPRVRGNRAHLDRGPHDDGSIPACTGEPVLHRLASVAEPVYPRVYGGTSDAAPRPAGDDGLSPRVRGNLEGIQPPEPRLRSIPACTGEPVIVRVSPPPRAVYPRVYGGTPSQIIIKWYI